MEQKPFPGRINGQRIYLQRHSLSLAVSMFNLIDENREHLKNMPWIGATLSVENSRSWINYTLAEWDNLSLFDYGIYLIGSEQYLGSFGVHSINWEFKNCELGYWIGRQFQGHGFVSEALRLIEAQCFKAGFHRVEIRCDSRNQRSAQVALRNGYILDGELREDVLIFGEYRNTKVFGKLHREWRAALD
ncbi:MAG: GNAT family N-acetyltransferase [Bacillota bacterium]